MGSCITRAAKVNSWLKKRDQEEAKNILLWILAIVGAIVAVAAVAYAVYSYFVKKREEEYEEYEDFGYGFEDDFVVEDAQ